MGLVDKVRGKKIYLDSNLFIYLVEKKQDYIYLVNSLFNEIDNNNVVAFSSELSLQECLVKPFIDNDIFLQNTYNILLQDKDSFFINEVNRNILIESSKLRAKLKLKSPDSIHLATAIFLGCDLFITNDDRIKTNLIEILYLSNFI